MPSPSVREKARPRAVFFIAVVVFEAVFSRCVGGGEHALPPFVSSSTAEIIHLARDKWAQVRSNGRLLPIFEHFMDALRVLGF